MKSFKQWLNEMGKIVTAPLLGNDYPISIAARNINVARKELNDHIKSSRVYQSEFDDEVLYRGLYHKKTRKFYIWWATDTIHAEALRTMKIPENNTIEIIYYLKGPSGKEVRVRVDTYPGDQVKADFHKFFGKSAHFRGDWSTDSPF